MRNKLFLFLMLALFGSTSFLRADEVTIGDPTSTETHSYLPTYSLYNYSFTQQIYTADEIGMGGSITEFTMWLKNNSSYARNLNVYMKEVSESAFADGNAWVSMTDADLVATGTLANAITSPVETTFTLTTPFNYSGNGNLVICFQDVTGSWSSGAASVVMTSNATQAIYAYRDAALYDPANPGVTGYTTDKKSVVRLTITSSGPVPPTPGEGFAITPNEFALGDRPNNGWMEPFTARISGAEYAIEVSMSNTSGDTPFTLSDELNGIVPEDGIEFSVLINNSVEGNYTEELTVFYAAPERDIITVPVTANIYTAAAPDIVEKAGNVTWTSEAFSDTPDQNNLHANYNLFGMDEMMNDAVYAFSLGHDYTINATAVGADFIAIYKATTDLHLTADVEPVVLGENGAIENAVVLAGNYYLVVAGDFDEVTMEREAIPAPEAITYIDPSPADGAMNVDAPVTLAWEGGDNATQYRVLFGTTYPPDPVMDWTMIDENYGTYVITDLAANTQYFWQIQVKNSEGNANGELRGFTSTLTAPHNVTVTEDEIFTDGSTLVKWKHSAGQSSFTGEITVADGTETNSYIPVYGLWMDDYTRGEMIYPEEMLEEMVGGEITSLTYYISSAASGPWTGDVFNVYMMEVDATTMTTYYTSANAEIVYTGSLDGQGTTMTINLDTPYAYTGGNLLVGIEETVCGTYKSCSFYGVTATGASASGYSSSSLSAVTFNQRNFLPKTTFTCGGRGYRADMTPRNFVGYNLYYKNGDADYVKVNNELITEKQYLLQSKLPYNINPGDDIKVTAVYEEGESNYSADDVKVKVSGYGKFTGTVTEIISGNPVAGVTVKFNGKDEFQNNVNFQGITNSNGVYTINNVKAGNYIGIATLEGAEPAMSEPVTLAYTVTETVDFIMHEVYVPVLSVYAEEIDPSMSKVQWSLNTVVTGNGGNTPGGGSTTGFTEGFENGMPEGWTVIDGNNDGYTWCMTSAIPSTWTYYASMSLDWYRTGTNAICSGSYINGVGALTPNEYLVTPQVNITNGTTFSFWAAATDAGYPADHFGVAVSDNGTSDWTMVNEWTLTGKGDANTVGGPASRNGKGAKLGTWYNFSVDLSAYAGQKYIAIRHFNCNDEYIMCVDDIELGNSKANRSIDNPGPETYAVYRKAILKETELVPADSVLFGTTTDTLYADFDWNNCEPGLYQYGVSAIYPSSRKDNRTDELTVYEGTTTNNHVPMYVFYFDDWTRTQFVIPAADLEEMAGGTISALKFYTTNSNVPYTTVSPFDFYVKEVDYTAISAYETKESCQLVYSGTGDFVAEGAGGMITITFDTPYSYNGGNLLIGCENTADNGYKNIYFNGTTVSGASISGSSGSSTAAATVNQQNFIPMTTFVYEAGGSGNDDPVTPITWSNILPKDMANVVIVNGHIATGSLEGANVNFVNTFEPAISFSANFDETGTITFDEFFKGEYTFTASLLDYTSNYELTPVSIWNDTVVFDVTFSEVFKPVEVLNVSSTGYAYWSNMLPEDRVAERYHVMVDDVFVGETTDNFMQLEDLTEGDHVAAVAVVYSTGMSAWVTKNFTYTGCEGVATQVEGLAATNEPGDRNVILTWNGAQPTPPTPPTPPTGDVVVKLTAHNVWGDGTGYQMLLDDSHSLYGTTIPTTGALSTSCSGNDAIYAQFSHKIPTNADGNCSTSNMVLDGTVEITIPAGTYDWCITNPTPGDRIWIAAANGNVGGRYDDYVFEGGHTYEFTVSMYGSNDGVDVTITGGKVMEQHNMGLTNEDVRIAEVALDRSIAAAGQGFGMTNVPMTDDGNWYYYDNGSNDDAIGLTAGGGFYWGIMIPAGQYEGNSLTKIAYFDYAAHTGTVTIYQGGTSAPGTQLYSQPYSVSGTEQYIEIEMNEAVELDDTQNVWVVMHNNSGQYVAAIDGSTGVTYGSCISTDGSTWYTTIYAASSGSLDGNWNLRAYIETGSGTASTNIVPGKFNIFVDGEVVGNSGTPTFTYEAPDFEEHEYVVIYVDANYGMSCEASIVYAAEDFDAIDENNIISAIYPNPTNGDLHISANGMNHINVVNALGQVVYSADVEGNEMVINMAKFNAGIYMVNIVTNNGTAVKRVVVTK